MTSIPEKKIRVNLLEHSFENNYRPDLIKSLRNFMCKRHVAHTETFFLKVVKLHNILKLSNAKRALRVALTLLPTHTV